MSGPRSWLLPALLLAVAAAVTGLPDVQRAEGRERAPAGQSAGRPKAKARSKGGCRKHKPQRFLVRKHFVRGGQLRPELHRKAVRWRAERYGWIEGLGLEAYADQSAISQAVSVTFMGLPIRVHKKIVPALRCVERALRSGCQAKGSRYVPRAIGGFREANSYRGGEISNHLFGIAIDIDPERNPCCGCVDPWPSHPACQDPSRSVYEKTELPRCWIKTFEQHGFHWLGHDTLEDTMHFEYLGDPDR